MPQQGNAGAGIQSFADFYRGLSRAKHEHYAQRGAKDGAAESFEAKRQHLLALYKDVKAEHSFADGSGQIFDCVPRDRQPALTKRGERLATPPDLPAMKSTPRSTGPIKPLLPVARTDRHGNAMACPVGTVAIRRVTLEEMSRFESLEHFLRKGPRSHRRRASQPTAPAEAADPFDPPHEYAHAYQEVNNVGGRSILNIWAPAAAGNRTFSLSQQWYAASGPSGLQTVEAGWQVCPAKYGHAMPVLFTYWTGILTRRPAPTTPMPAISCNTARRARSAWPFCRPASQARSRRRSS
jgi:hypothetical protein